MTLHSVFLLALSHSTVVGATLHREINLCVPFPGESANAVQERHYLGNNTPVPTVKEESLMKGQCRTQLDEVVFVSIVQSGVARGNIQFAINGAQVGIDGARTNDELFGDLGIGESLCDQA